jgi:hypothetical protein
LDTSSKLILTTCFSECPLLLYHFVLRDYPYGKHSQEARAKLDMLRAQRAEEAAQKAAELKAEAEKLEESK